MRAAIRHSLLRPGSESGSDHSCYYCNPNGWNDTRLAIESAAEYCALAESMTMNSSSETVKTQTPCSSWRDSDEALVNVTVRSEDD